MRQVKSLFFIPLLLILSGCPSTQDPHSHNLWIKCEEDKDSSNLTPENFIINFTITHNSDHQHNANNPLRINKEELSKTIVWRNNLKYAAIPYFSTSKIALHINEQLYSSSISRNIQYHIDRSTLVFGYTYTRSDVQTNLVSNRGGLKVLKAGKCRHIKNPEGKNSI